MVGSGNWADGDSFLTGDLAVVGRCSAIHSQMNEYSCSLSVTLVLARNLRSISEQESRIAFGLGLADDSPPNDIRTDGDITGPPEVEM